MFTTIEQFEKMWSQESEKTQNILKTLTNESLSQAICDDHRTLGRMAWHIVETFPEMMNKLGLKLDKITPPVPKNAQQIKDTYVKLSKSMMEQIKGKWSDASLMQEDDLYGEKWKRGLTLLIFLQHEIHHRGQMTVLMRQANLKVPSIYGPAKEGWVDYGMPVPEI
ncbi:MAG: DinB family protein [Candidatus Zixiibacteriota bacterium]